MLMVAFPYRIENEGWEANEQDSRWLNPHLGGMIEKLRDRSRRSACARRI